MYLSKLQNFSPSQFRNGKLMIFNGLHCEYRCVPFQSRKWWKRIKGTPMELQCSVLTLTLEYTIKYAFI